MARASFLSRLGHDSKGVAVIEAALIMPILLLMLVGLIDFSMALFKRLYTQQIAISGLQLAVSGGTSPIPDAQITAQLATDSGLPSTSFAITRWTECNSDGVKYPQGPCASDTAVREDFVKLTVTNTYKPIFGPGLFGLVPAVTMTSSATGRLP